MSGACGKIEELLIDLLYDELDPKQREEVLAHCQECTKCQFSLEELQLTRSMAGLSGEEGPFAAMDEAILEMAREQAAAWADSENLVAPKPSRLGIAAGFSHFLENLRALALHPATVSASVVVVITVLAVFVQQQDAMKSETYPALETEPAIPFEFKDTRPDAEAREAARDDAKLEEAIATLEGMKPKGQASPPPAPQPTALGKPPTDAPAAGAFAPAPSASQKRSSKPKQRKAARPERRAASPGRETADLDSLLGYGGRSTPKKKTKAAPSKEHFTSGTGAPQPGSVRQAESKAAPAESFAPAPAPSAAAADDYKADRERAAESAPAQLTDAAGPTTLFDEGRAAYNRGNCAGASSAMQKVATGNFSAPQKAEALYVLGDCAKRRGNCSGALTWFDQLLSRHPGSTKQGPALWSAALCHKKLGQTALAKAKLQRLLALPTWKTKAQQMLDTL